MDKRLIAQWEAERLPEREEAHKADALDLALADFSERLRTYSEIGPYDEPKPLYSDLLLLKARYYQETAFNPEE